MMKNTQTAPTYIILKPERKTPPTIVFSRLSLKWIENLVDLHAHEIGFYGVVDKVAEYSYFVRDIFYPKHQLASAATCEISSEGEAKLIEWLLSHGREEDISKMMLWGHSHHSMGVFASGQDDTQALERMSSTKADVIRVIVNNDGLMSVSFFDYAKQIRFDNIVWSAEEFDNETLLTQKLTEIKGVLDSNLAHGLKLAKIMEACTADPESEKIKEKIEELKKINIPPEPTSYTAPFVYHRDDYRAPLPKVFPGATPPQFNGGAMDEEDEMYRGLHPEATEAEVKRMMERYEEF